MVTRYVDRATYRCMCLRSMLQDTLTEGNYRLFFSLALDVLLRPWEKFMMGFKFTEVKQNTLSFSLSLMILSAWRHSLRPRFTVYHHILGFTDGVWRRQRKIRSSAANIDRIKSRQCKRYRVFKFGCSKT